MEKAVLAILVVLGVALAVRFALSRAPEKSSHEDDGIGQISEQHITSK